MIVIIVLGILAATAVPKFINLQDDAKVSAMTGVEAAVHSAANIVYSKSAIDGTEKQDSTATVTPKVGDIVLSYGFPTATATGIKLAVELSGFKTDFATTGNLATISFVSENEYASGDLCLLYTEATSSDVYKLAKGKVNTAANACDTTTATNGDW